MTPVLKSILPNFIIPAKQDNWMRRKIDGIAPEIAKF